MVKTVKGTVAPKGFYGGDTERLEAPGKRQYEIDNECSQFNVALTACRDSVCELAERLTPFLSEPQDEGEGKCDVKLSCPLAIEIQGWRHRAEAINSTVRDILRRLEVDQSASPKSKD